MTLIDVLVFDGCEALDVLGPYEVIAYGGLDVRAVTRTERRLVRTSQGLELAAEAPRDGAEWLIVPGGAWDARHANPRAEAASGAWARSRALIIDKVASWPRSAPARCGSATPVSSASVRRPLTISTGMSLPPWVLTSVAASAWSTTVTWSPRAEITSGMYLGLHLVQRLVSADARRRVEIEIELPNIPDVASSTTA